MSLTLNLPTLTAGSAAWIFTADLFGTLCGDMVLCVDECVTSISEDNIDGVSACTTSGSRSLLSYRAETFGWTGYCGLTSASAKFPLTLTDLSLATGSSNRAANDVVVVGESNGLLSVGVGTGISTGAANSGTTVRCDGGAACCDEAMATTPAADIAQPAGRSVRAPPISGDRVTPPDDIFTPPAARDAPIRRLPLLLLLVLELLIRTYRWILFSRVADLGSGGQ